MSSAAFMAVKIYWPSVTIANVPAMAANCGNMLHTRADKRAVFAHPPRRPHGSHAPQLLPLLPLDDPSPLERRFGRANVAYEQCSMQIGEKIRDFGDISLGKCVLKIQKY